MGHLDKKSKKGASAEMNEDEAIDNVVFRESLMTRANEKAFPV